MGQSAGPHPFERDWAVARSHQPVGVGPRPVAIRDLL